MREIIDTSYSTVDIHEVNRQAKEDPKAFVQRSEEFYNSQVMEAAKRIKAGNGRYVFVLLSGPSASGKTTTAHKLKHRLATLGGSARVVSMDNFFTGMRNYPQLEDGTPNMESIEAMDLNLLNSCFEELLETGESMFPVFDFETQTQTLAAEKMNLNSGDVIIMEGIHSLNPLVLEGIPDENIFRMYVSVRAKFVEGEKEILRPGDIRLLRRMVRDYKFRNYDPVETLEYWHNVRANERTNMDPYRDAVDLKMDNTIDYEVCVWRELLKELLSSEHKEEIQGHPELVHIFDGLVHFEQMDFNLIPDNSLLREFIGKRV